MSEEILERKIRISNKHGLHLRAAGRFVETANLFDAEIRVRRGSKEANGKSIIDMMTLGAGKGSNLLLLASGKDASAALKSLEKLVANRFGEE